jgi:DNA repair protein RecN (Recombination protein N)
LEQYQIVWKQFQNQLRKIEEHEAHMKQLAQQREFIQFQFEELEKPKLKAGEEEELEEELTRLEGAGERKQKFAELEDLLHGDDSCLNAQLKKASRIIAEILQTVPSLKEHGQRFENASLELQDALQEISSGQIEEEADPARVDFINSRLSKLQALRRKFQMSIEELIELKLQREKELLELSDSELDNREMHEALKILETQLNESAEKLSSSRSSAAQKMSSAIEEQLHELNMSDARFEIRLDKMENPGPAGQEKIEFLISPNKGGELLPLKKSISGGELSRVMLAIKTITAHNDSVPVVIFDEVDSGISGQVGHRIGKALQKLGDYFQVLSVTHLHQVAARAHNQIKIWKENSGEEVYTRLELLDKESRIEEICRMMGGDGSATSIEHAKNILQQGTAHVG